MKIFLDNLKIIEAHNSQNLSWKMGVNQMADLTNEEFATQYLTKDLEIPESKEDFSDVECPLVPPETMPLNFDHTEIGGVKEPIDQKDCKASWAFAITSSMEYCYFFRTNFALSISTQQMIDCGPRFKNESRCLKGNITATYDYIKKEGLMNNNSYPYTGKEETCKYDKEKAYVKFHEMGEVKPNCSISLMEAVLKGVVTIPINTEMMRFYASGIFDNCSIMYQPDHVMSVVGFGDEHPTRFFKLKNSWGTTWGENGFMRIINIMSRDHGPCGYLTMPQYPICER